MTAEVELTASLVDLIAAVPEAAALILQAALQPLPLPAELKTFAIALVKAGGPAVTETVKLFTETLPASAQNLIAAGKFAHLVPLAANAVYLGTLTPIAPFLVAVLEALPLPIGTQGGALNEFFKLTIQTPFVAGTTVLTLLAEVIDDGLSPAAALSGAIDAISSAVTSAMESIEKIVVALGGALPINALAAPEALDEGRALAVAGDTPAVTDVNVFTSSVDTSTRHIAVDAVTVTVDPSLSGIAQDTSTPAMEAGSEVESADTDESDNKPQDSTADVESPDGATDLSDGNMAEPGTTHDRSAGDDNDGSTSAAANNSATESAPGDQTATTNDSSTGSTEGSGDDGDSSGD
ncbi:hypothetical protein [Mycobacterium sp.]|uniref:hypothetical protein n=1 Tax=Mycobacterium sp. TaxID=1785 RepID=UPI002D90A9DC|nr:hypothetical protein [Mycobacterium sp.]